MFLVSSLILIPLRVSFDQNGLGNKTFVMTPPATTSALPALPRREQFFDLWLVTQQLLMSITQGEHELQRYFGSFTDNIPIGFIQQVYATTKTVTSNGGASIDTSQSEFGGASGKFVVSSSQYLSLAQSTDFDISNGAFTVDFWVRFNSLPSSGGQATFFNKTTSTSPPTGLALMLYNSSGTLQLVAINQNVAFIFANAWSPSLNTWYHVAFVRSGNSWYSFVGGTQVGSTATYSTTLPTINNITLIGAQYTTSASGFLDGWLDEYRVTKGLARWTSNFTPPTTEYVSDSYTVLLLHMDGPNGSTTFTDSSFTGPDFSIGASPGSQSIGAGASALSTLTLTALGGYSDQVDLVITSGCSATGMSCTLNGSSTASVPGGSGTVPLAVNTQVNTPPAVYPVVITGTDDLNSAITHQATFTVTVGAATSYQFNVKGTATQIVVTLTYSWNGSGTPPQGTVTISAPSGPQCNPSCLEAAGAVYDRTSIAVSNAGNTYSIIHRVTFTITAPGALPAWTAYVTLSGVSTYTVTIEVS